MSSSIVHPTGHPVMAASAHATVLDAQAVLRTTDELRQARLKREERIDNELVQRFPASDPPSWVHGIAH